MSNGLVGTCVYTGMQVTYGNIRAKVQSLLHREQSVRHWRSRASWSMPRRDTHHRRPRLNVSSNMFIRG